MNKYNRETNPLPTYAYELIKLSEDKNTHQVLSTFDNLQDAIESQKLYRLDQPNVHINMRPLPNDR